jgi:hypothetical protein
MTHRSVWYEVPEAALLSTCDHGRMATLSMSSGSDHFTIEFLPAHREILKDLLTQLDKVAGDEPPCPDEPPSDPPEGHVFVRRWVLIPKAE